MIGKKALSFFIIFALIYFSCPCKAQQNISFRQLTVNNGLSQSTVTCMLQDHLGVMWFGTMDGLNKYDGHTFYHYKYEPDESNSIPAPAIISLAEDQKGIIWIGTDGGGLCLFNPLTDKFSSFKHDDKNPVSLPGNRVTSICIGEKGQIYMAVFGKGICALNTETKKFSNFINSKGPAGKAISNNNVKKIILDHEGFLWAATRGGLNKINLLTGNVTQYFNEPGNLKSLPGNITHEIFIDKKYRLWIGTYNGGIAMFDKSINQFKVYPLPNEEKPGQPVLITSIYEDNNSQFWVGTNGMGLKILNPETGIFRSFKHIDGDHSSLGDNEIFTIFGDKSGIIWIGTRSNGVSLYHKQFGYFNRYATVILNQFKNKDVYALLYDSRGYLLAGTNGGGLYQLANDTGIILNVINQPGQSSSISGNNVWALAEDNDHNLWVGTNGSGISMLGPDLKMGRQFRSDTNDVFSLHSNFITNIFPDHNKKVWISTQTGGLNLLDKESGKFTQYIPGPNNTTMLSGATVLMVMRDNESKLWIGTQNGGLNYFDEATGYFKHYMSESGNPFAISNNDVQYIYSQGQDLLWLGTKGGLNVFSKSREKFLHFTEKDGLPNNYIYTILPDDHGNLWLSTNKGISRFTPPGLLNFEKTTDTDNAKPVIRNYFINDGLLSNEYNQNAACKDKNGTIYFGGINGITAFHPDSVIQNTYMPNVIFTRFSLFEKEFKFDTAITFKKVVVLSYDQQYFSFDFAALSYLLPEKNQYAVMMEGFDHDWLFLGNKHSANYTNLDPGSYVFKVKASNNDGKWSHHYASVDLIITPPFWKTWWFKLAMVALFLSAVYAIYVIRIRQIKKEEARKTAFNKELAEVEMKALRAQMNPHFIFNSLNSINKYIWANDQRKASEYLTRFSKLIRLILENSRHQSIPLDKDLEGLELYMQMEGLRFEQHFDYKIELSNDIETESILIPPLLLQPFVENSIWHGLMPKDTSGTIKIKISIRGEDLHCMIEDNGVGRERAMEIKAKKLNKHNSLGMKVTMDRIDILNQQKNRKSKVTFTDLYDDDGKPSGTRVELSIPLEYSF